MMLLIPLSATTDRSFFASLHFNWSTYLSIIMINKLCKILSIRRHISVKIIHRNMTNVELKIFVQKSKNVVVVLLSLSFLIGCTFCYCQLFLESETSLDESFFAQRTKIATPGKARHQSGRRWGTAYVPRSPLTHSHSRQPHPRICSTFCNLLNPYIF